MRRDEFLAAVEPAHHHAAIAIGLVVQIGMRGQQPLGAACRQQRGVKALVQPVEIRRTLAEFIAGALDMPAHLVQRADDTGLPGIVAVQDGKSQRLDLDHGAHLRDVEQILAADIGDAKAALADADDQPARYQPRQSLAQRRGADLVALDQIDDAQTRARRESAGDDVALDQTFAARSLKVSATSAGSILRWLQA